MSVVNFIHIPFNTKRFARWAGDRGMACVRSFDIGYSMHVFLAGVFGSGVVQPYRLFMPRSGRGSFFAYTHDTLDDLLSIADIAMTPNSTGVLGLDKARSKPLPTVAKGQRVGFDVRVRPTRRWNKQEADAYWMASLLANGERREVEQARHEIYQTWLEEKLDGIAVVKSCRLARYDRIRAAFGKQREVIRLPSAVLHGDVEVTQPDAFHAKLASGIGRHKAYGFGMMMMRPPSRRN